MECLVEQPDLEGTIFERIVTRENAVALEFRGLRLVRGAPPAPERVAVVCDEATLLNPADELRAIEHWSDWRRQIDGAIAIDATTLCLMLAGGLSLIVQCRAWHVERAALVAGDALEMTRSDQLAAIVT